MAREASLEQLVALSDEIAALARSGAPLEAGLRSLGKDFPGGAGRLASRLGERMERGESLTDAIDAEGDRFPPIYRAVVKAGVRSGNLAAAVEGLAEVGRRMSDVRHSARLAMIYPVIVTVLTFLCTMFFLVFIGPKMFTSMWAFGFLDHGAVPLSQDWRMHWPRGWLAFSSILFAGLLIYWWRFSQRGLGGPANWKGAARWPLFARRMIGWWRAAAFADLLALLLEHKTPLDEAVILAAEGSGDPGLSASMLRAAERIRNGDPAPFDATDDVSAPLLLWRLAISSRAFEAPAALRSVADDYRMRAMHSYNSFRMAFPLVLTFLVGAPLVGGYALFVFLPWTQFIAFLSSPSFI